MSVVEVVFVKKLKRPFGSGTWGAYVLANDEFGTWLHTPAGSHYQGKCGEHIEVCDVAQDSNGAGRSIVQLIPPDAWWIATWYPPATDDWDEFRAARAAGRISSVEATKAMEATRVVEGLLRQRTEPFGCEGTTKLATAMELALPPLVARPPSW